MLEGLPGGRGLNIAHEAVDRHAQGPLAGRVALRWLGKSGERREFTYRELAAVTNRFANALRRSASRPAAGFSCCSAAFPSSTSPCSAR